MLQSRYSKQLMCALALVALFGCANPADNKTEAVVADAEPTPATEAAGQKFIFGEGSTVGFVGSKVTGSHDGGFKSFEGEIVLVDGDAAKSRVHVVIDATSVWSDSEKLTGHLKSPDFFDVENFPTVTFTSTAIAPEGDGYSFTGNLELHGVTKSITFPASVSVAEDEITAQAEFFIQRFDFDIVYPGRADDLIRDEVVLKFDLRAKPGA